MIKIKQYQDFEKFLANKLASQGVVFGIGVTAFMRFFPSLFVKNFQVITFKNSKDNQVLEKFCPIFCLKKRKPTIKLKFSNANNLLRNKTVRKYISSFSGKKYLFLYKDNNNIQNAIRKLGVTVIGNPPRLNKEFENKANFRKVLVTCGIKPIFGETLKFEEFQKRTNQNLFEKYGPKFVLQLPDYNLGGGKGTLFIDAERKLNEFRIRTASGFDKKKKINLINVTRFIKGQSCSIACCATKQGTLVSKIQQQIIDIPQVISPLKGNGLFCGHVFGQDFAPTIVKQAQIIGTKLGNYMYRQGYRGIFGIDLLIDKKHKKVYPVECNARYTGAFPMLSMLQIENQIIPLDFFHFLEFLKISYKIDLQALNKMYQKPLAGSHIILSNIRDYDITVKNELAVGRYEFRRKKIIYLGPEIFYTDLKNHNQFVLVDGVPQKKEVIKKYNRLARIVHVLFKANILQANGRLKPRYLQVVYGIYKALFNSKQP